MIIPIPVIWRRRAIEFGKAAAKTEDEGGTRSAEYRVSGEDPAWLHTYSKVGECGLALMMGLDPKVAVNWDASRTDKGWDITQLAGRQVDVKSSDNPYATALLWPLTRRRNRDIDDFVFARVLKSLEAADMVAWISEVHFWMKCHVAGPNHSKFREGTHYLDQTEMNPFEDEGWPT